MFYLWRDKNNHLMKYLIAHEPISIKKMIMGKFYYLMPVKMGISI